MTLTPQPTDSLVEYVTHQGDLLTRMAAQAETLGFCVVMHGLNHHTYNNRLYNYHGRWLRRSVRHMVPYTRT